MEIKTSHPVQPWMVTTDEAAALVGRHRNTITHAYRVGILRGYRDPDSPDKGRNSGLRFDPVDIRACWPPDTRKDGKKRRWTWRSNKPIDERAVDEAKRWEEIVEQAEAEHEQEAHG